MKPKLFQVLLHVQGLLLANETTGAKETGGAWITKCVAADDKEAAVAEATRRLFDDALFLSQIWNDTLESVTIEADEVHEIEIPFADSSPVFYVEE